MNQKHVYICAVGFTLQHRDMKNAAQDTQLHFAIEQTIMDLVDNGTPREEIKKMMAASHPMLVERVRYYVEMWNAVKSELDSQN